VEGGDYDRDKKGFKWYSHLTRKSKYVIEAKVK
jgi:hypothetical protein